jgi:hypothetical protein
MATSTSVDKTADDLQPVDWSPFAYDVIYVWMHVSQNVWRHGRYFGTINVFRQIVHVSRSSAVFCETCIHTYITSYAKGDQSTGFKCPICRRLVSFEEKGGNPETWSQHHLYRNQYYFPVYPLVVLLNAVMSLSTICDNFHTFCNRLPHIQYLVSFEEKGENPETWSKQLPGNHFVLSLMNRNAIIKSEKLCNSCERNQTMWYMYECTFHRTYEDTVDISAL